jgi:hypothetical protein
VLILMYRLMSGKTAKNPTTSTPIAAKLSSFEVFTVLTPWDLPEILSLFRSDSSQH